MLSAIVLWGELTDVSMTLVFTLVTSHCMNSEYSNVCFQERCIEQGRVSVWHFGANKSTVLAQMVVGNMDPSTCKQCVCFQK